MSAASGVRHLATGNTRPEQEPRTSRTDSVPLAVSRIKKVGTNWNNLA